MNTPSPESNSTSHSENCLDRTLEALRTEYEDVLQRHIEIEQSLRHELGELRELNQVKNKILSDLNFELRTPLNGIINLSESMLDLLKSEPERHYQHMILSSARRLNQLLQNLLDIPLLETARLEDELEQVNLLQIIEDWALASGHTVQASGREFISYLDPALSTAVRCDPSRITQLLHNLIERGMSSPDADYILFSMEQMTRNPDSLRVRFSVEWVEISPEQRPMPGAAAGPAARHSFAGLPFKIMAQLVEQMGGTLRALENSVHNCCYFFDLPLPCVSSAGTSAMRSPGALSQDTRFVIVDKHPVSAAIIRRQLEATGAEALSWPSLSAALEEMPQTGPTVILISEHLFPAAASETQALIRLRGGKSAPRIVLMTSALSNNLPDCRELPVDACLRSPLLPSRLEETIKRLIPQPDCKTFKESRCSTGLSSGRILVVEDNQINQIVAENILKKHGYGVTLASSGEEALDLLEKHSFDLVLMDIDMPGMDGYETTRRLRGSTILSHIPVVALTALTMSGDEQKCLAAGMDGYVAKPVNKATLLSVVERFIPALTPQA